MIGENVRSTAVALAVVLAVAATACGGSDSGGKEGSAPQTPGAPSEFNFALMGGQKYHLEVASPLDPTEMCTRLLTLAPDSVGFAPRIVLAKDHPDSLATNPWITTQRDGAGDKDPYMSISCTGIPVAETSGRNMIKIAGNMPLSVESADHTQRLYFSTDPSITPTISRWSMEHDTGTVSGYDEVPSALQVDQVLCGDGLFVLYDPQAGEYTGGPNATAAAYCAMPVAS